MSNIVPFANTAIAKEAKHYKHYSKLIEAEQQKQSKLRKQIDSAVDAKDKAVKDEQAKQPAQYKMVWKNKKKIREKVNGTTGMTTRQRQTFIKSLKQYKSLLISQKNERKWKAKRKKYDRYKAQNIAQFRKVSKAKATNEANSTQAPWNTSNSYIMPNDARSDDSYVAFMVTNESDDQSVNVATEPVESGVNIQTATQTNAPTVSLTAKIYGLNMHEVKQQVNKLTGWSKSGAEMYFSGPHDHPHCTISDVSVTYNWGEDGSLTTTDLSISLTIAQYFNTKPKSHKGAKKDSGSKGRKRGRSSKNQNNRHYVIAKSGMTYAYIADKKNTSVQSLQEKNSYPATKIPVGAKIYY